MRFLLFVVLSSIFALAQAADKSALEGNIQWKLSLDADGNIETLKPVDSNYMPEVRKQLEPIVRAWHYTPGKVGGHPVSTQTTLTVEVAFEPESTDAIRYHARIKSATTGGAFDHSVVPRYPKASLKAEEEGGVMLWVNYDAKGAVTSVRNVPEMSADVASQTLTDAAIEAVKRWTFRPESVAGHGVASDALVPVCFILRDNPCHWKPWPGKPAIRSGGAIALSSVVGLDTGDEARHLP